MYIYIYIYVYIYIYIHTLSMITKYFIWCITGYIFTSLTYNYIIYIYISSQIPWRGQWPTSPIPHARRHAPGSRRLPLSPAYPSCVCKKNMYMLVSTQGRRRLHEFLPQLYEFYFTTDEEKNLENLRCIVPNFINEQFI
jgi:hypothetical protein